MKKRARVIIGGKPRGIRLGSKVFTSDKMANEMAITDPMEVIILKYKDRPNLTNKYVKLTLDVKGDQSQPVSPSKSALSHRPASSKPVIQTSKAQPKPQMLFVNEDFELGRRGAEQVMVRGQSLGRPSESTVEAREMSEFIKQVRQIEEKTKEESSKTTDLDPMNIADYLPLLQYEQPNDFNLLTLRSAQAQNQDLDLVLTSQHLPKGDQVIRKHLQKQYESKADAD